MHKHILFAKLANFNTNLFKMTNFGSRLKEERLRISGGTQAEFGGRLGVSAQVQSRYEAGEREPKMEYWPAAQTLGIDVLYVITGQRNTSQLSADEADLVRRYREAPDAVRAAAVAALAAGTEPSKYSMNFAGATIGQQTVGDVTVKGKKIVGIEKKK